MTKARSRDQPEETAISMLTSISRILKIDL